MMIFPEFVRGWRFRASVLHLFRTGFRAGLDHILVNSIGFLSVYSSSDAHDRFDTLTPKWLVWRWVDRCRRSDQSRRQDGPLA
jgi:hypothetical protein